MGREAGLEGMETVCLVCLPSNQKVQTHTSLPASGPRLPISPQKWKELSQIREGRKNQTLCPRLRGALPCKESRAEPAAGGQSALRHVCSPSWPVHLLPVPP